MGVIFTVCKQTSVNDWKNNQSSIWNNFELTDSSVTLNKASFQLAHSHQIIFGKEALPRNEVKEDPSDPLEPVKSQCDDTDVRMGTVEMTVVAVCVLLVLVNEHKASDR